MKRFWCIFFMFWPLAAIGLCWIAPERGWWFPTEAMSPLGQRIDDLFYMILIVTTVTFILTQIGLGYALWTGAARTDPGNTTRAWFTHGSHNLEVIWSMVPAGILLYIALYQFDVWREFRMRPYFPEAKMLAESTPTSRRERRRRWPRSPHGSSNGASGTRALTPRGGCCP